MPRPILLDVAHLCDHDTDSALEFMAKAIGEPPGDDIWAPHPNPYVRRVVELFSDRGIRRSADLEAELRRILSGAAHDPRGFGAKMALPRPESAMRRWSASELGVTKLYLESLPPDQFTLDDWMLAVDYLVQRYLSPDDLISDAEWLATRADIMGRVEARIRLDHEPSDDEAETILAALPASVTDAAAAFQLTPEQVAVIEFGRARCCEFVTALSDSFRHRMRRLIVDWQEAGYLGDKAGAAESLQSRLLDEFGTLNRDWRRIAVTEATENINQGFISSCTPGTKVRRVEKYRGACPFCRSINGTVMTVVDPADPAKDGGRDVWVGKNNIGRSASPMKRSGDGLVEREPHELWWVTAGTIHPHCRGAWVRTAGAPPDPIFEAWLEDLRKRRGAAAVPA